MDGFKNSTKTQYAMGGACKGYAKGGSVKGAAKISKVMGEFKSGELHSGSKSGPVVKNPKQATAIAMSEARKAGAKMPMKKADGGSVESPDVMIANMTKAELAAGARGIKAYQERMKREKIGNLSDREMQIKERVKKSVPVPRREPMIGAGLGAVTAPEMEMLRKAARPSVEAGDLDPRLMREPYKKGGMAAKKGKC
jgi:hypothetical protein